MKTLSAVSGLLRPLRSPGASRRPAPDGGKSPRAASGFSLIEVMLSLVVVGGGLVAVFGLFPVGLRQGVDARSDMAQATFASTVLETIAANVRSIDNLEDWEDVEKWWKTATRGTGQANSLSKLSLMDAKQFASDTEFTLRTREAAMYVENEDTGAHAALGDAQMNGRFGDKCVFYVGREEAEVPSAGRVAKSDFLLPPQFLVRIVKIERYARYFRGVNASDGVEWNTYRNDTWDNGEYRLSPARNVTVRNLEIDDDGLIAEADSENSSDRDTLRLPSRYLVSVVSSDEAYPQPYVDNPVFSQEYAFLHHP